MKPYACEACGATGCKMWREYQTLDPRLLCALCAAKQEDRSIEGIDERGERPGWEYDWMMRQDEPHNRTEQIGWMVPAIPTPEGDGYWGLTSVRQGDYDKWVALPTLPEVPLDALAD